MVHSHDGLGDRTANCHWCRRQCSISTQDVTFAAGVDAAADFAGRVDAPSLTRRVVEVSYRLRATILTRSRACGRGAALQPGDEFMNDLRNFNGEL
ncbi:unnamed protein product [Heligmosomoides polygyrus]|uniref:4Fe-4S Wbl-type domain-containing protein n=1 Tax=Heligmosomoides polygyrus TaxID=6339 RepID=A0A183FS18_HELPZ|nr:unnamed protein product [Heligmosomoides polygyrus]